MRVVTGDFNGDGKRDLVTIDRWSNTITVLAGDGAGGVEPFSHSIERAPCSLSAGDFNGAGRQDLAVRLYHDAGKVEIPTNRWQSGAPLFPSITAMSALDVTLFRRPTAMPADIAHTADLVVSDFTLVASQDLVASGTTYDGYVACASFLCGVGEGGVGSQLKLLVGNNS